MAKKKEHIKFSHNEFLNLSEYLREKNTDNESIKIINSVEYCIHLIRNMSFADKFDLESDIIPFIGFSFVGKNEDAIFKEFRKAYINLKNNSFSSIYNSSSQYITIYIYCTMKLLFFNFFVYFVCIISHKTSIRNIYFKKQFIL